MFELPFAPLLRFELEGLVGLEAFMSCVSQSASGRLPVVALFLRLEDGLDGLVSFPFFGLFVGVDGTPPTLFLRLLGLRDREDVLRLDLLIGVDGASQYSSYSCRETSSCTRRGLTGDSKDPEVLDLFKKG